MLTANADEVKIEKAKLFFSIEKENHKMTIEVILSPLAIGLTTALFGSVLGGYSGFYFVHRIEGRSRMANVVMDFTSDEFTDKRLDMQAILRNPDSDLKAYADPTNAATEIFRKNVIHIFNKYEVVCHLIAERVLDRKMFNEHLKQMIKDDFDMANIYFANIESAQIKHDGDLRRPFFPYINKIVGRGKTRGRGG